MHNWGVDTDELASEARNIAKLAQAAGLRQSQIAYDLGLSQSQVSRVLGGKSVRRSAAFDLVCNYVRTASRGNKEDSVRENAALIEALAVAWDGTQVHAEILASIIRSFALLRGPRSPSPSVARRGYR